MKMENHLASTQTPTEDPKAITGPRFPRAFKRFQYTQTTNRNLSLSQARGQDSRPALPESSYLFLISGC